jgi:L,D-transpeptidase catalytic domain
MPRLPVHRERVQPRPQRTHPRDPGSLIARLRRGAHVALHARPGGRTLAVVGPISRFGSRTTLGVVRRVHGWAAVTAPELPPGHVGWFRVRGAPVTWSRTRSWIRVDLSARRMQIGRGRHVVENATVGIGQPGTPTPRGRFSITDKLSGPRFGPTYGRFILALSGSQTKGLSDWNGPKRVAIHGTSTPARIGKRASLGCVVASDRKLARIVHEVRLGTPVTITP